MMILPALNRAAWNPWDSMERDMRRLLQYFDDAHAAEFPLVNIWSDAERAYVTAELPGIDPEKLDVTVQNDTVTIKGVREPEPAKEGESWLRRERQTGRFVRSFGLPFKVESEHVAARYERGVLTVTLPRIEEEKPRKIAVTV